MADPSVDLVRYALNEILALERRERLADASLGRAEVVDDGRGRVAVPVRARQVHERIELRELESLAGSNGSGTFAEKVSDPLEERVE